MNFINNIKRKYEVPVLVSLIFLPIASIIGIPIYIINYGIVWQEIAMLFIGWFFAGTGITIGYHRLFAHRTFKTYPIIEWFYMLTGSMALQNSILKWCSDHRRHHKKLDTKDDPYSIKEGFFHAHIGWIIKKGDNNYSHVSDLERKSAVKFQEKYYWSLALFLSFVLPMIIGYSYGRPIGGLLWGGILRTTLVHHFTFFINSLCHYLGNRNYDPSTSARDSWIMAFLTFGEGYHNYHHKFQWDYRNGIKWYNFDPSKWIIKFLSLFNITYGLRKVPDYLIFQAKVDTLYKKINTLANYVQSKNRYISNMNEIIKEVTINLDLWKNLEQKYKGIKEGEKISNQLKYYKKQKIFYELELQKSISSLMLILVSVKNSS
jgi:stearoyl-CoA desaturase (delta-9 desaturase)